MATLERGMNCRKTTNSVAIGDTVAASVKAGLMARMSRENRQLSNEHIEEETAAGGSLENNTMADVAQLIYDVLPALTSPPICFLEVETTGSYACSPLSSPLIVDRDNKHNSGGNGNRTSGDSEFYDALPSSSWNYFSANESSAVIKTETVISVANYANLIPKTPNFHNFCCVFRFVLH